MCSSHVRKFNEGDYTLANITELLGCEYDTNSGEFLH